MGPCIGSQNRTKRRAELQQGRWAAAIRHPGRLGALGACRGSVQAQGPWSWQGLCSGLGPLELAGVVGVVALGAPGAAAVLQVGLAHARLVAGVAHELAAAVRVGAAPPVGAPRALEQVGAHAGPEGPRMAQLPLQAAAGVSTRPGRGTRCIGTRYVGMRYVDVRRQDGRPGWHQASCGSVGAKVPGRALMPAGLGFRV